MNIELKDRINYRILLSALSVLVIIFGALGIIFGIGGLITVPLTAASLAAIITIEKRRIASLSISAILIIGEIVVSFFDYFTVTSLFAVVLALIISYYFRIKKDKSECVLFCTLIIAVAIIATAALFFIGTNHSASLSEIYEAFLAEFDSVKKSMISSLQSIATPQMMEAGFTVEYMNDVLDVYLNLLVAMIAILAFILTGLTFKLFRVIIKFCQKEQEQFDAWLFAPSTLYAYLFYIVALISMFIEIDASAGVVRLSIVNLYLILMFVYSYVGFRFSVSALKERGRTPSSSLITVLILTVLFAPFSIQLLAAFGAFITISRKNLIQDNTHK